MEISWPSNRLRYKPSPSLPFEFAIACDWRELRFPEYVSSGDVDSLSRRAGTRMAGKISRTFTEDVGAMPRAQARPYWELARTAANNVIDA